MGANEKHTQLTNSLRKLLSKLDENRKQMNEIENVISTIIIQAESFANSRPELIVIQRAVEYHCGFIISKKTRKSKYIQMRSVFDFIARSYGYTLKEIGIFMCSRDHTTVYNSINQFANKNIVPELIPNSSSKSKTLRRFYTEEQFNEIVKNCRNYLFMRQYKVNF
jgi:chromosomal replication initiation ATPase DnaA